MYVLYIQAVSNNTYIHLLYNDIINLYSILNEWRGMRRNYMRNSNVNKRGIGNCSIRKQRKNYSRVEYGLDFALKDG